MKYLILFSACLDGFYGVNCMKNCSRGCFNNTACDKTSGVCIDGKTINVLYFKPLITGTKSSRQ